MRAHLSLSPNRPTSESGFYGRRQCPRVGRVSTVASLLWVEGAGSDGYGAVIRAAHARSTEPYDPHHPLIAVARTSEVS